VNGLLKRDRQRGWVGLVLLLVALLIVAVLSQRILRQYGLLQGSSGDTKATATRSPGDSMLSPSDATSATPLPANAVERARGVEATIQQQADDASKRIDDQSK
jgi:hypothetical protein